MNIIATNSPKYTVTFSHPDSGIEIHTFFIDSKDYDPSYGFNSDEEVYLFNKDLAKSVWDKFNTYGYYHTMTIVEEWIIDGKAYQHTICEEWGYGDF